MHPIAYRITYLIESYAGRKESFSILAMNVREALDVADRKRRYSGNLANVEPIPPRWMDSDASQSPDAISESVLRHYAEKIGMELVHKSA
jgi:hypothetical protein